MAGGAIRGEAQIRPARILDLDCSSFLGRNVRRIVALGARQPGMLSLQNVTGIFVIEAFNIPLDQGKVFAVVLGVAAGALLAGTAGNVVGGVQALVS